MNIEYNQQADEQEIMEWLEKTIPHLSTSSSKRTGFGHKCVVYGVHSGINLVYIRDEKYATMFMLRWS